VYLDIHSNLVCLILYDLVLNVNYLKWWFHDWEQDYGSIRSWRFGCFYCNGLVASASHEKFVKLWKWLGCVINTGCFISVDNHVCTNWLIHIFLDLIAYFKCFFILFYYYIFIKISIFIEFRDFKKNMLFSIFRQMILVTWTEF